MDFLLFSYLITVGVSFAVGIPTLVRALRRSDTPLILLGAAVTIDATEWLAWTLASYTPASGTPLGFALSVTCRIGIAAAAVCLILFTRTVFRPQSRAAKVFVALIVAGLAVSILGSGAVGDWQGVENDHIWVWLEQLALMPAYGWACIEAGRQYRMSKRRASFGLGDALVAHRQLLWSTYAGMLFLAEGVYIITLAFYGMMSSLDILNGFFTIVGQLALGTAVFAPKWYVKRFVQAAEG